MMVGKMTNKTLARVITSGLMVMSVAAPAFSLDYEAKPVAWVLMAPIRTVGGLSGAAFSGLVSGPIDGGYHGACRGTTHVAGQFGDEKGNLQLATGAPIGGTGGAVVGGTTGGFKYAKKAWKTGWNHPFSRWSYLTMEEK
jgi:hypothetical protein